MRTATAGSTSAASATDQRTYGHAKLSDLIRATGRFDVEAGAGGAMRVRVKPR